MIKIAVCDDIIDVSLYIKNIINEHFRDLVYVDNFVSGEDLLCSVKVYDIVFLDIDLKEDMNGMDVSRRLHELYPKILVIFFTGCRGYEKSLLQFEPFRFLEKPIDKNQLIEVTNAAIKRIRGIKEQYYLIKNNAINYMINVKDIVLFSSISPYIIIQTKKEDIKIRSRMDNIEREISKISDSFIRTSKSYLINKRYIESYSSKEVRMTNEEIVPISRKYSKKFMEYISSS